MNTREKLEIFDWKKEFKLTRTPVVQMMLEAWRRVHMFNDGLSDARLLIIAMPSQVKGLEDYMKPSNGSITPRVLNWYRLTKQGKKIVDGLSERVSFSKEKHNLFIFEGKI